MFQVRTYDLESGTSGPAHVEWVAVEGIARNMEADATRRGLVALVLDMETAGILRGMNALTRERYGA